MKLYVGIPAYNAEDTIKDVLERVLKQKEVEEVIIVDDGSKDDTVQIVKKMKKVGLVRHKKNRGYGGAQKTIYKTFLKKSKNEDDAIVMIHSDGQTLPEEIPKFYKTLQKKKKADLVLGSRALGNMKKGKMPSYRIFGDHILTLIQNLCFGMKLSTYASGYRCFRNRALKKLKFNKHSNIHEFDTQILVEANEKKLKMVEIPVATVYRGEKSQYNLLRYSLGVIWYALEYALMKKK